MSEVNYHNDIITVGTPPPTSCKKALIFGFICSNFWIFFVPSQWNWKHSILPDFWIRIFIWKFPSGFVKFWLKFSKEIKNFQKNPINPKKCWWHDIIIGQTHPPPRHESSSFDDVVCERSLTREGWLRNIRFFCRLNTAPRKPAKKLIKFCLF